MRKLYIRFLFWLKKRIEHKLTNHTLETFKYNNLQYKLDLKRNQPVGYYRSEGENIGYVLLNKPN